MFQIYISNFPNRINCNYGIFFFTDKFFGTLQLNSWIDSNGYGYEKLCQMVNDLSYKPT